MRVFTRIHNRIAHNEQYPAQIWLLFWGTLVSITGQSFVWPFLTVFIREQLDAPLSHITPLFTLQSIATLATTGLLGPLMDRTGRKSAMVLGPIASSLALIAMAAADSLVMWAIILSFYAASGATYRIGVSAMIADLIEPERRANAYALLRMAFNVGIAVGPAIGGFLVATSYTLSFFFAAVMQLFLATYTFLLIKDTLPAKEEQTTPPQKNAVGYGPLLHDRPFLTLWGVFLLVEVASSMVFTLLAVYIKENYGVPEDQFGFILGTNATMVVLFQYSVTRFTQRFNPLPVMALGALFYMFGMLSFGLGSTFMAFWLGMVILTVGELVLVPTSTALAANLAPPEMRARYMGVYSLSYRVGSGVGPVLGGFLNDTITPSATWYGAALFCLAAAGGFLLMVRSRTFAIFKAMTSQAKRP